MSLLNASVLLMCSQTHTIFPTPPNPPLPPLLSIASLFDLMLINEPVLTHSVSHSEWPRLDLLVLTSQYLSPSRFIEFVIRTKRVCLWNSGEGYSQEN